MEDKKKNKKDREKELRNDGLSRSTVNYNAIVDRQVGDKRFERERAYKLSIQEKVGFNLSSE